MLHTTKACGQHLRRKAHRNRRIVLTAERTACSQSASFTSATITTTVGCAKDSSGHALIGVFLSWESTHFMEVVNRP